MASPTDQRPDPSQLAGVVRKLVESAPDRRAPTMRPIRRQVSRRIAASTPAEVVALALELLTPTRSVPRWFVYEVVHHHRPTLAQLDAPTLSRLGHGMSSWGEVDPFGCYLSGVAWREGQVADVVIHEWARSDDRWWRRTALVSTVALNRTARGGTGDAPRTLAVCRLLETDRDDMVVKALSWALRELVKKDAAAVATYLDQAQPALAPRVLREVRNKLDTGLKNPRK